MRIQHGFLNTGNAEVILTGGFHILNSSELLFGKGTLRSIKTFPGDEGFVESQWEEELPPGKYTVLITFELGPDAQEAIVREFQFEVP